MKLSQYIAVPEGNGKITTTYNSFGLDNAKYYFVYTFNDPNLKPVIGPLRSTKEEAQVGLDHFKRTGKINFDDRVFNWHEREASQMNNQYMKRLSQREITPLLNMVNAEEYKNAISP